MVSALTMIARWVLWGSVVAMCLLTFVWPFAISSDPEQPLFKLVAIAALLAFLASMLVLLTGRLALRR